MASPSRPRSRSDARALWRAVALAAGVCLAAAPGTTARAAEGGRFLLIASPDVPLHQLSAVDARRLMLGEQRYWSAGHPITTLVPGSGTPTRSYLLAELLRMTEAGYRRHTLSLLYRGQIDYAPKVVASDAEAIAFVAAGHGVVALIEAGHLSSDSVQVIAITDGPAKAKHP